MNVITLFMAILWVVYREYIGNISSVSDSYRMREKGEPNKQIYHIFFASFAILLASQQFIYDYKPVIENFLAGGMFVFAGIMFFCISIFAAFWKPVEIVGHPIATYGMILTTMAIIFIQRFPLWDAYFMVILIVVGVVLISRSKLSNKTMKLEDFTALILLSYLMHTP